MRDWSLHKVHCEASQANNAGVEADAGAEAEAEAHDGDELLDTDVLMNDE